MSNLQSPQTYAVWLAYAERILQDTAKNDPYLNPKIDANLLLQFVTQRSKSFIFAFSETPLMVAELNQLHQLLMRRVQGEPIAYILGEKEFWSLPLKVSMDTLIPRPDTEILVEKALDLAYERLKEQENLQILDLGTGTGAIALALAYELGEKAKVLGIDKLIEAVELAECNRQNLCLNNVYFLQSDWFSVLKNQRFDLIVSNPPYLDEQDENLKIGDVRFEPLSALVSGNHGLSDLQKIIQNAPLYLCPKSTLLLEHGWQQAGAVQQIFQQYGWSDIHTKQDYGGKDRITWATLNN